MQNLWDEQEAQHFTDRESTDDLALRVYSSRLLGRDKSLVLHGGGNTSVKIAQTNIVGEQETILYVKGSGWDLQTIEAQGFAPVRMNHLLKLAQLKQLTDAQMVNELKTHMTSASAPAPSVETILHALLPYKYVDHTHSDAIVSISNTDNGADRITAIYGNKVVIIPYVMPGFDLSRLCAERFPQQLNENTIGMVLMNHGLFSFGATARESYERMITLVSMAENYLARHQALDISTFYTQHHNTDTTQTEKDLQVAELCHFRQLLSEHLQQPVIVHQTRDKQSLGFANHPDIEQISQQGPATPDHVIRTKQRPLLLSSNFSSDINNYITAYKDYFESGARHPHDGQQKTMLDPLPRIALHQQAGLLTIGKTIKDAYIVRDIYQHTMDIILRATQLGGYRALPDQDIFDVEYWELEQAKLKKSSRSCGTRFDGEVALVTGAVHGIGKACVDSLLARGACVVAIDILPEIEHLYQRPDYLGITCDVSNEQALHSVLEQTIRQFGGLDIVILNAGIFPGGCRIEDLSLAEWRKVMAINLDANLSLMSQAQPFLKRAPNGGRIITMGSKNVPAPGPGAAAYSAAKAALTQLARVAALEWGQDNIRINVLHPNAVFDTAIWTDEVLASRAKHYGLTIQEYKTNNLLHTEISSHDVAELAVEMCGPLFAKTTAAQVPIDGGNDRVV